MSASARLFFALWPDDAARSELATLAREAQVASGGGRAIPAAKIHLTLFFVGAIDARRIPALEAVGQAVRSRPFDLALDVLGHWRHNRIVWAGAARCPAALVTLAADLRTRLAREGVQGEDHPFIPHVTLVRDAARAPGKLALPPCAWRVDEFVLVESQPHRGGVRYAMRARWPL